jgi:HTH-type transcriptional regulator/antitoxin HigA
MKYRFELKPIKTKNDYRSALLAIDRFFDAKPNSIEANALEILTVLVEKYEEEHFPIEAPNPIEAIKFRMEQLGLSTKDIVVYFVSKSRVSEFFSGKRGLTKDMIVSLHKGLKIPAKSLLGVA